MSPCSIKNESALKMASELKSYERMLIQPTVLLILYIDGIIAKQMHNIDDGPYNKPDDWSRQRSPDTKPRQHTSSTDKRHQWGKGQENEDRGQPSNRYQNYFAGRQAFVSKADVKVGIYAPYKR